MKVADQPVAHDVGKRRHRSLEEKRRIVEMALESGVSVAIVARQHGINANQLFYWRKLYKNGLLGPGVADAEKDETRLLPVSVVDEREEEEGQPTAVVVSVASRIHIEFPGRALVSVEGSAELALVRVVLESLKR